MKNDEKIVNSSKLVQTIFTIYVILTVIGLLILLSHTIGNPFQYGLYFLISLLGSILLIIFLKLICDFLIAVFQINVNLDKILKLHEKNNLNQ